MSTGALRDRALPDAANDPWSIAPALTNKGGGGNDGGMEARVAALEVSVKHIERDVADIKTSLATLNDKIDRLAESISTRFDGVRDRFDTMRDRQERDFRIAWGGIIAVALGLAGLMARGFGWWQ